MPFVKYFRPLTGIIFLNKSFSLSPSTQGLFSDFRPLTGIIFLNGWFNSMWRVLCKWNFRPLTGIIFLNIIMKIKVKNHRNDIIFRPLTGIIFLNYESEDGDIAYWECVDFPSPNGDYFFEPPITLH